MVQPVLFIAFVFVAVSTCSSSADVLGKKDLKAPGAFVTLGKILE